MPERSERWLAYIRELSAEGIRVSLFIKPDPKQLDAARSRSGAPVIELHTGAYCEPGRAGASEGIRSASGWPPPMPKRSGSSAMPDTV